MLLDWTALVVLVFDSLIREAYVKHSSVWEWTQNSGIGKNESLNQTVSVNPLFPSAVPAHVRRVLRQQQTVVRCKIPYHVLPRMHSLRQHIPYWPV